MFPKQINISLNLTFCPFLKRSIICWNVRSSKYSYDTHNNIVSMQTYLLFMSSVRQRYLLCNTTYITLFTIVNISDKPFIFNSDCSGLYSGVHLVCPIVFCVNISCSYQLHRFPFIGIIIAVNNIILKEKLYS